jgi:hypothetical protein
MNSQDDKKFFQSMILPHVKASMQHISQLPSEFDRHIEEQINGGNHFIIAEVISIGERSQHPTSSLSTCRIIKLRVLMSFEPNEEYLDYDKSAVIFLILYDDQVS